MSEHMLTNFILSKMFHLKKSFNFIQHHSCCVLKSFYWNQEVVNVEMAEAKSDKSRNTARFKTFRGLVISNKTVIWLFMI